ncbi:hypothetical protein K474DRAFT_1714242 [Panus rudis PR-1116 ss-1]|nr:hypothetical protein K474DRAFT_1714242 [Panus rudis PR-1116 ss-1]
MTSEGASHYARTPIEELLVHDRHTHHSDSSQNEESDNNDGMSMFEQEIFASDTDDQDHSHQVAELQTTVQVEQNKQLEIMELTATVDVQSTKIAELEASLNHHSLELERLHEAIERLQMEITEIRARAN